LGFPFEGADGECGDAPELGRLAWVAEFDPAEPHRINDHDDIQEAMQVVAIQIAAIIPQAKGVRDWCVGGTQHEIN
jgi:hypothetical protein